MLPGELIPCAFVWHDPGITPCCKTPFALVIKNSPGFGRDLRVRMWGTSSPTDKLTGDLGNVIEATQIGGRLSARLPAKKKQTRHFLLFQHLLIPKLSRTKAHGSSHPLTHEAIP